MRSVLANPIRIRFTCLEAIILPLLEARHKVRVGHGDAVLVRGHDPHPQRVHPPRISEEQAAGVGSNESSLSR